MIQSEQMKKDNCGNVAEQQGKHKHAIRYLKPTKLKVPQRVTVTLTHCHVIKPRDEAYVKVWQTRLKTTKQYNHAKNSEKTR